MLIKYIQKAMEHARYEILSDDGSFYGEIPECHGVYASAITLEECRNELEEILEEWILFRIYKNLPIPKIDGLEIKIREEVSV
ncbi:MAG: type II toxin-antitoxin system HicB family antitoxin [Nitrospirae bacterium]|nr:type II toxin-antitoxin system HicB family antitoxin [Nitrospirota bacterium]